LNISLAQSNVASISCRIPVQEKAAGWVIGGLSAIYAFCRACMTSTPELFCPPST
jgi:hypothetical protein